MEVETITVKDEPYDNIGFLSQVKVEEQDHHFASSNNSGWKVSVKIDDIETERVVKEEPNDDSNLWPEIKREDETDVNFFFSQGLNCAVKEEVVESGAWQVNEVLRDNRDTLSLVKSEERHHLVSSTIHIRLASMRETLKRRLSQYRTTELEQQVSDTGYNETFARILCSDKPHQLTHGEPFSSSFGLMGLASRCSEVPELPIPTDRSELVPIKPVVPETGLLLSNLQCPSVSGGAKYTAPLTNSNPNDSYQLSKKTKYNKTKKRSRCEDVLNDNNNEGSCRGNGELAATSAEFEVVKSNQKTKQPELDCLQIMLAQETRLAAEPCSSTSGTAVLKRRRLRDNLSESNRQVKKTRFNKTRGGRPRCKDVVEDDINAESSEGREALKGLAEVVTVESNKPTNQPQLPDSVESMTQEAGLVLDNGAETMPSQICSSLTLLDYNGMSECMRRHESDDGKPCLRKHTYACVLCRYTTSKRSLLDEHVSSVHGKVKPYPCDKCEYSASRKHHLDRHVSSVHDKVKPYVCDECEYSAATKHHLNRHISVVHKKLKPYSCDICHYSAVSKGYVDRHVSSTHLKMKPYSCDICQYTAASKSNLNVHVSSVHYKLKPFSCDICQYNATRKTHLALHIASVHDKVKPYICDICQYSAASKSNLVTHISSVHNKEKPYSCDVCGYSAASKTTLSIHISSVHNKVRPYLCDMCRYSSASKGHLLQHIAGVHYKLKPYSCHICRYSAATKSSLNRHIMCLHKKLKPYVCDVCKYSASCKTTLRLHILSVHNKVKPYLCDKCDYSAASRSHLSQHVSSVHHKLKPFSCDMCHYSAARKRSISRHIERLHNRPQPYSCRLCHRYSAICKSQVDSHVSSGQCKVQSYLCDICKYSASNKCRLKRHIVLVHNKVS